MSLLETLSKQVRCPDEKCSAVSFKTRLPLARYRAVAAVIERVVVADIKGRTRIRVPAEKELPGKTAAKRIVIHSCPHIDKTGELIGRSGGNNIGIKGNAAIVVPPQAAFCVIK